MICISDILSPQTARAFVEALDDPALFADGRKTAGRAAAAVKHNLQAAPGGRAAQMLKSAERALMRHEVFRAAARPKALVRPMISRYEAGMAYGWHVDEALMDGRRTDLSFTLFLSPPDSYEGGELELADESGELCVKLAAGAAVLYPTGALHRVRAVQSGVRLAIVGWVRSQIRRADQRAILYDLELAARALARRPEERDGYHRLLAAKTNLLRLWAED